MKLATEFTYNEVEVGIPVIVNTCVWAPLDEVAKINVLFVYCELSGTPIVFDQIGRAHV